MSKLWLQNGKVVVDSTGRPILCDVCPCPKKCESMLTYLNTLYATYGGTLHGEGFLRRTTEGDDIIIIGQAALVYTMESVAMIAVVGCGEGDECEWTNQQLVAETDTWFDVSGVCTCPGLVTMRLAAEANGYTYYQEGFYSPLRLRHVGDTAHKWDARTLYRGAYWDGAKWVVMRCNCTTFNLSVPSGRDSTYYKFFEYPGACECLDVRRAIVEYAADLGISDWEFGPDWIIGISGGTRYRVSTSQSYRDLDAFSFIEADSNGYSRFYCIGTSVTSSPGWAFGAYEYIEEAALWVEYTPQPNLSVYGEIVLGVLITNSAGWTNFDTYDKAVAYSESPPDYVWMTHLTVESSIKAQFSPKQPGEANLTLVTNRAAESTPEGWRAKKDYYLPDIIGEGWRNFVVIYAHQWICTSGGVLIRGNWDNLWSSSEIATIYGLVFSSGGTEWVSGGEWTAETPCTPAASLDCPGDDGAWKEEIE